MVVGSRLVVSEVVHPVTWTTADVECRTRRLDDETTVKTQGWTRSLRPLRCVALHTSRGLRWMDTMLSSA